MIRGLLTLTREGQLQPGRPTKRRNGRIFHRLRQLTSLFSSVKDSNGHTQSPASRFVDPASACAHTSNPSKINRTDVSMMFRSRGQMRFIELTLKPLVKLLTAMTRRSLLSAASGKRNPERRSDGIHTSHPTTRYISELWGACSHFPLSLLAAWR